MTLQIHIQTQKNSVWCNDTESLNAALEGIADNKESFIPINQRKEKNM